MLNKLSPTIVVIDSGMGGISILNKLIEKFQAGNYIYYADNLYMPYGNKPKDQIKQRILSIIEEMRTKYNPDKIIIACNTASAILKNTEIERVIKLEFNKTDAIYLTTPLTEKILKNTHTISSATLAKAIEDNIDKPSKLNNIIKSEVKRHKLNKISNLILGCTHYELVEDLFKKYCPKTNVTSNSLYIIDRIEFDPKTDEISTYFITSRQEWSYIKKLKSLIH